MVGYSRMYLAAHFFLDVYVGSILGTVFTTVIFAMMNKYRQDKEEV
jgi:membrane-associated phospholipid phosphatase